MIKEDEIIKAARIYERQKERSMIHPQYANRFIRQYILDEKEVNISE